MIAGITAYYAIGLKNVYDDMSDAPAAGLSLFMFMIVYLFEDMSFVESLLLFFEVLAGQLEGVWNLLKHGNMRLTEHGS